MTRIPAVFLLALAVAGCAISKSNTAEQAQADLIGFSKEQILTCMGAPVAEKKVGTTEVWSYFAEVSRATVTTGSAYDDGYGAYGSAVTSRSQNNCTANISFKDDLVAGVSYTGDAGGLITPYRACYPLIKNCLP